MVLDKRCNDQELFDEISKSVAERGRFSVPMLLKSKLFRLVFCSPEPMASGTKGVKPHGHAPSMLSSEAGESRPSRGEHIQQDSHSRDESVEYLGTLRKELKRILPHIPDLSRGEKFEIPF